MKKKIIALVCCRGGSKGVPNKNIKLFHGKPMIYWTFKNIIDSKIFNTVYLSTDSVKIAKIGKKIGFIVPELRPKKLARNNSDVFETHKYFFKNFNIKDKNSIVCIINNNPFILSKYIKKSFVVFKRSFFQKIVMGAISISSDQVYYRQYVKKNNGLVALFKKDLIKSKINRKKNKIFFNVGDLRWGKPSYLDNYKKFNKMIANFGLDYFEIKEDEYQDINTINDWNLAKLKFKRLK
jgi:CMP-N-acetylneuraminic acid synthetase